jgi:hypothetical protein
MASAQCPGRHVWERQTGAAFRWKAIFVLRRLFRQELLVIGGYINFGADGSSDRQKDEPIEAGVWAVQVGSIRHSSRLSVPLFETIMLGYTALGDLVEFACHASPG